MKLRMLATLMLFGAFVCNCGMNKAFGAEDETVFKVVKVKGNQAIVQFSKKKGGLKVGDVKKAVDKGEDLADFSEKPSRDHFLGLETGFSMLTTKTSAGAEAKVDRIDLNATYGWNKETIEYGVLGKYTFEKLATTDSSTIELGGLFDFNFSPNIIENDFVPGVRLIAAVGQQDNSAYSAAANTLRLEPDFVVKWFGLSTNLAAIGTIGYQSLQVKHDTGDTTVNGIVGRLGIQAYF